jgi:hypothetical protein
VEDHVEAGRAPLLEARGERQHLGDRRVGGPEPHGPEPEALQGAAPGDGRQRGVEPLQRLRQRRIGGRGDRDLEDARAPGAPDVRVIGTIGIERRAREGRPALAPLVEQRVHAGVHRVAESLEDPQRAAVHPVAPRAVRGGPHAQRLLQGRGQLAKLAGQYVVGEVVGIRVSGRVLGPERRRGPGVQVGADLAAAALGEPAQDGGALRPRGHLVGHQIGGPRPELLEEGLQRGQARGV